MRTSEELSQDFVDEVKEDYLGKGKEKLGKRFTPYFQPKETWTHDFCFLAKQNDDKTPTRNTIIKLNEANLGRRKIVFPNKSADHDEVKSILEKECPKLKSGGGFLLLHAVGGGAGQRSLQVIHPGEKGYSIPYLRCTVCVGQAITFVRPLQADLNMDKVCDKELAGGPTTSCLSCGSSISYGEVKKHQEECRILNIKKEPEKETALHFIQNVTSEKDKEDKTVKDLYLDQLKEMFPNEPSKRISDALKHGKDDLEDAISFLLGDTCIPVDEEIECWSHSPILFDPDENPLQKAMEKYQKQKPAGTSLILNISRNDLWKRALIFYKSHTKDELRKPLNISFDGPFDVGIDAGGPSRDFFGDVLRNVNLNLFEGKEHIRIPQHSWEKASIMKLGGIAIAHSILHNGPTFPVIAPYVFYFILSGNEEIASAYVQQKDLPRTPSNKVMNDFIDDLINADDDGIVDLLQREDYGIIVDRSGWPTEKMLNVSTVPEFIHYLLVEELVTKRVTALTHLREGINYFGLVDVFKHVDPSVFQCLLCGGTEALTADKLLSCFESKAPTNECELAAYNNLMKFIKDNEGKTENIPTLGGELEVLVLLLKFVTAHMTIPPLGFAEEKRIKIEYLPVNAVLPDADACFSSLKLPIKYNDNYSEFSRNMLTSLTHATCSYGQM